MSTQSKQQCPICKSEGTEIQSRLNETFVICPTCGRFEIYGAFANVSDYGLANYDKLASYLYYNGKYNHPIDDYRFFNFIGNKENFEEDFSKNPWCFHVTKEIVDNWYPKTLSAKIDIFLLGLYNRANFLSESILFSYDQLASACFVVRKPEGPMKNMETIVEDQVEYFVKYLINQGYVESDYCSFVLLPKGLERIDSLQKNNAKTSKNVFVAMSFDPKMKEVREAIKNAITECGYIPRIMDEIEHNHQIVPEMLYEIRQARFVIAELTGHNNGAYFEAGYALGYDKEVIQVCEKSKFGEDGHFDVKQINTVLWETSEDLTSKLIARIKATIS